MFGQSSSAKLFVWVSCCQEWCTTDGAAVIHCGGAGDVGETAPPVMFCSCANCWSQSLLCSYSVR
eukprot:3583809-Amphidinium_carterae.1